MEKTRNKLKLRRWCIRRLLQGWSVSKVADHAQTPQRTVYAWRNRFQRNGWVGLTDASRRPHRIHRLPEETVKKVIEVRRREGWCSETIAAYLQRQKVQVSSGSVHSILKQNQLITKPYKPRRQRTYIRFQREHPDSLWQTDIKYYGDRYLIAFLDDCSRYLTGIALLKEATTSRILHLLDATLRLGRTPRQILSDHGSQFYSDDSKSIFTQFCEQHGIEHILGSIGKPTTQGKIERFFQTFTAYYPRFSTPMQFREYYNQKPHRSLNFLTPAEAYLNQ